MAQNPYAAPVDPYGQQQGPSPQGGNGPMQWEPTEVIGHAWDILKSQAGPLVGALLVYLVITIGVSMFLGAIFGLQTVNNLDFSKLDKLQDQLERLQGQSLGPTMAMQAVAFVVQTFFTAGFIKMYVSAARGEQVSFGDLFSGGGKFLPLLLLFALEWVAKLMGPAQLFGGHLFGFGTNLIVLLVLIIPSCYIALALTQAQYFVVDQGMNPIDAIKASFKATQDQKLQILLFWVLAVLIIIGGGLACCIGLLAAIPVVEVGAALMYVRLSGTPGSGNSFAGYGPPGMGGWGPPPGGGYGGPPGGGYGGPPGGGYGGPPGGGYGGPPGGGYGGPPGGGFGGPPGGGYGGPPGGGYGGPPPGGGYGGPPPGGGYGPGY